MSDDCFNEYFQSDSSGNHISCIYRTDAELFSLLVPFFTAGLQKRNRCVYITSEHTSERIIDAFDLMGLNLSDYIENGDFIFLNHTQVYTHDGNFQADSVISSVLRTESSAIHEGYAGLWVTGNGSWLQEHTQVTSDFMKYEAKVNSAIQETTITAICQYNEQKFPPHVLIDVIRTHPDVYLYDRFLPSKYFAPSDNFIPLAHGDSDREKYEQIIASL